MTKIRPSRLAEIEADDFSNFPSLAYAKGFLLIYGKFLDVDVSPYLEAFETSECRDGRRLLLFAGQPGAQAAADSRSAQPSKIERRCLPVVIGVVVLVGGFVADEIDSRYPAHRAAAENGFRTSDTSGECYRRNRRRAARAAGRATATPVEHSGGRDDTRADAIADGRELDTCSNAVGDAD